MHYSSLVKKAVTIMFEAHKEDKDKGGYPYVFHPFYLATQVKGEYATCVALLHDVVEDHSDKYSFEFFAEVGFPTEVIEALRLLTHKAGVSYRDYIEDISKNALAREVKIEDLKHNMDTRRIEGKKSPKYELYKEALAYLEENKTLNKGWL